jgi:hypothetical protein
MNCSDAIKETNPDPVTAQLAARLDLIMAKPAHQQTAADRELLDIVINNRPNEMSEATFNRMYCLLFGNGNDA